MRGRRPRLLMAERHRDPPLPVKGFPVAARDPRARRSLLREPAELDEADRRPDLVEAVVEPLRDDVVARGMAAVPLPS